MEAAQFGASQVVCQVLEGRNLNMALEKFFKDAHSLSPQQRGALQDLSYGTLRFYGQLARILEQLLHKPVKNESLRCLLLVALYQLQYSKAAAHAVVDHAVHVARKLDKAAGGLVNAVLRNFLRNRDALLAAAASSDEGRYAYPQWWIDEIRAQYGERAQDILLAGNQHPPMTLRVNRRRTSSADYLALLEKQNIPASLVDPGAILLAQPVPVGRLPGFAGGLVSVQDAGAQYAAYLLEVQDGMRVLDACAAPGGKCAHLLELAQIDMTALDKDALRLERVGENLQRLGLQAALQTGDAMQPGNWWDGRFFQRILADVPCSASGVVRRHPDIKWLRRASDIEGFAQQQLRILESLWQLLERGGKLLYATCSVFEQENRQVIGKFLQHHSDAQRQNLENWKIETAMSAIPGMNNGQLLPDSQHDGFYYALLYKNA